MNISPIFYLPVFGAAGLVLLNWLYGLMAFLFHQRFLSNPSQDHQYENDSNNQDVADDDPEASPPLSAPRTPVQAVGDTLPYDGQRDTMFVNDECMICLSTFKDGEFCQVLMNCKHVYHRECIDEWMLRNSCCPICRAPAIAIRVSKLSETLPT